MKLTPAQRVALERVREERVRWYQRTGKLVTLGRVKRVQARTIHSLEREGLVEVVYRGNGDEGIVILTSTGREALETK